MLYLYTLIYNICQQNMKNQIMVCSCMLILTLQQCLVDQMPIPVSKYYGHEKYCIKCAYFNDYILYRNFWGCKTCQMNLQAIPKCNTCQPGYYLSSQFSTTSNFCSKCEDGCKFCQNSQKCITCFNGLYLTLENDCLACSCQCCQFFSQNCISCSQSYQIEESQFNLDAVLFLAFIFCLLIFVIFVICIILILTKYSLNQMKNENNFEIPRQHSMMMINDGGSMKINKQQTCSICLRDDMTDVTPCQHCFHKHCIDNWVRKVGSCPDCKKKLSISQIQKIQRKMMEKSI